MPGLGRPVNKKNKPAFGKKMGRSSAAKKMSKGKKKNPMKY